MKVRIKQTFRDKDNYNLVYNVGEEREFGKSRAQHLISMGLVEPIIAYSEQVNELFPAETQRKRGRKSSK